MIKNTGILKMQQHPKVALISIHPKYVAKILNGTKKVEFRRVWTSKEVSHLVIYSTAPEMKITATVEIQSVLSGTKTTLWETAKNYGGGLTREELRTYFNGASKGYALVFNKVKILKKPIKLSEIFPEIRPPQSYLYLTHEQFRLLQTRYSLED